MLRAVLLLFVAVHSVEAAAPVLIVNARVFDGARMTPPTNVLVVDGRIHSIGNSIALPGGQRFDAGGQWLIPGLIDAHVHTQSRADLEKALSFGVTTYLDMFTLVPLAAGLRTEQAGGQAADRADLFSAGTLITTRGGHGTEYGVPIPTLARPEDAQAFVDVRIAEGSDYIKIIKDDGSAFQFKRPTLDTATLTAVIRAAHARRKLAIVHIATLQDARDAVDAGADGLAHVYAGEPDPAIARLAAARKVFWTPTLVVITANPKSREAALACVRGMHDAGVVILAGTDVPNPPTSHGSSLHAEMELLVAAGLTPVRALAAATSNPAAAYGLDDRGAIAPGKRADLMLLASDPTREIGSTRKIVAIWKEGERFVPPKSTAPPAAQQSFTGTWKLDGIVLTIRHNEPALQYTASGRRGALVVNEAFEFTTDGKLPADPTKLSVIGQWEGGELVMRYVKDGKDIMKFTMRLAADGRQLIREATRPNGQQIREVYERQ